MNTYDSSSRLDTSVHFHFSKCVDDTEISLFVTLVVVARISHVLNFSLTLPTVLDYVLIRTRMSCNTIGGALPRQCLENHLKPPSMLENGQMCCYTSYAASSIWLSVRAVCRSVVGCC